MDFLFIISQFLHLLCAAVLVGGVFFYRLILSKYAAREGGLSPELEATVRRRWLHLAWNLIIVMVVTGLYQLSAVSDEWKEAAGPSPHMIFGIKFLVFLAILAVLAIATARKSLAPATRGKLMLAQVGLGSLILFLSAWLVRSY